MQRQTYDTLRGGSVARLRGYRAALARSLETIRKHRTPEEAEAFIKSGGYTSPLSHRYSWMGAAHGLNIDADDKARGYVSAPWELVDAWRDVGDVSDILERSRAYPGVYYSDAYQGETYVGHVWQLPARDGSPRYVAGYCEDQSGTLRGTSIDGRRAGGYVVLSCDAHGLELFDDKEEAARAADGLAERMAEKQREYDERWQEASQENDKRDEARDAMKRARADVHESAEALRELRDARDGAAWRVAHGAMDSARLRFRKALHVAREASERIAALGMAGEF